MIESVGCLALAEINNRLGRQEPTVLTKAGYSQDPDECRVQVILSWMRLTGLQNPNFACMLSLLFFEDRWKALSEAAIDGLSIGFSRSDREAIFARARQDCARLSPMGTAIISNLADRIERRRANALGDRRLEREQAEREVPAAAAKRRQEFLQAAIGRTCQRFLAEADARGWGTDPRMPIMPFMTLAEWRQREAHYAAFMMVAMAVQLEGLAERDGYNLDYLQDAFSSGLVTKEYDMIEKEARRLGLAPSDQPPDPELRRAIVGLVTLHANNARHCVEALQSGSPWPLHKFYQFLGPGFGRQSNEATLAARFDPVVLPMLAELRQKLAAAALLGR